MNQVKGTGASSTLFQHERPNKPQISRFDLSRKVNFSLDTGMIVPIELLETYPGDKFRINLKIALDTLPLVAPSLTNYKIVTHFYYMKKRDMWRGWKTFSTKGRSGNVNLIVPQVDLSLGAGQDPNGTNNLSGSVLVDGVPISVNGLYVPISSHSLGAYLGVPPFYNGVYNIINNEAVISKNYLPYTFLPEGRNLTPEVFSAYNKAIQTGFNRFFKVSALPFVMYQSICKHYYVNPNLLQDNQALFPVEGDDEWLLPYTIKNNIANFISGRSSLPKGNKINYDGVYSNDETDVDLRLLRYAMFDDDYFTTALKDLQRGEATTLSADVLNTQITSDTGFFSVDDILLSNGSVVPNVTGVFKDGLLKGSLPGESADDAITASGSLGFNIPTFASKLSVKNLEVSMTANQLRSLVAMSVWQERNMRVDGSYNRMIYQHWSVNPRSEEHVPVYIGGTVDYLNFSTVIQNSESSSTSPLGSTAGFGSSGGEGSVCSDFLCPDHGYIMGVMIIKPETIYQQGVDKLLTEITFDDFAQPEFQGLSPEGILNKELYVSGNDKDNELFAYQERYTYLKVRQNVNRGLMQCKPDKDLLFSAYTQARWFDSVPKFSYQFLCMSPDNLRRDWLAYPSYPAFRCQLLNEVFVTRKLSYTSEPNTFGF